MNFNASKAVLMDEYLPDTPVGSIRRSHEIVTRIVQNSAESRKLAMGQAGFYCDSIRDRISATGNNP